MLINESDLKISELSTEEYFYLTENLELIDSASVKSAVRYLVFNKKRKLLELIKIVMKNELSDSERQIAMDYWDKELPAALIAEKYGIARSTVYRIIDSVKKKLEQSLKYVLLYDKDALPQNAQEMLAFVVKENSIES